MYLIRKPADQLIREHMAAQAALPFTYPSVGATATDDGPPGYVVDRNQIRLGNGEACFDAARQALFSWQHYQFDWIELHRPDVPPHAEQTVGVLARALGLWVLNVCRVVYVLDENTPVRRCGFAYGTLPEHAESGEERFQVQWRDDDSVWYDILAFSRPNQYLARWGYPYVRRKQKQFARDSLQAMKTAVRDPSLSP